MKNFNKHLFLTGLVVLPFLFPLQVYSNTQVSTHLLCSDDQCESEIVKLHKMARHNNYPAMTLLSMIYATGDGREVDHKKALSYLERAAGSQHPMAVFTLSEWYREGFVVEQNLAQADALLAQAVSLGHVSAQYKKTLLLLQQADAANADEANVFANEAITLLQQASDQRSVEAMFLLAKLKQQGLFTQLDLEGAAELFKRLMLSGHEASRPFLQETIAMLATKPDTAELVADLQQAYAVEVIKVSTKDHNPDSILSDVIAQLQRKGVYSKGSASMVTTACGVSFSCNAFAAEMGPKLTNQVITGEPKR
ncbi:MAG: hypothetical protein NWQ42_08920 [Alishewanella sp.]|nr:hypothetical protein [Alishewanella sp.]MDP5036223.1 hypothetical protein [Alishewanella sp.]